jgi:hypothetical protein
MSRGVVLWPDQSTSEAIKALWDTLVENGIPSMATHTHRLHQPHVSLIVAEDLPVEDTLNAIGCVPTKRIKLMIEAAGVFPGGLLYLACVANQEMLEEQGRIQSTVTPLAVNPGTHSEPGAWTPHVTTGWFLTHQELADALPIVLDALPFSGWLDHGGIEDGTTGLHWPAERPVAV